jgi:predicted dehydrogenase
MSQDQLTCAIVGYGYMGEIRRRIVESRSDLKLEWICEPADVGINSSGGVSVTKEVKNILESDVDLVFICTPNNLIPALTIKCLDLKKHVFCEKPPGRTVNDVRRMQEAEKRNPSGKLMFGFNHRYHPGIMKAKAIVDSGRLGKILTLRGLYGKSGGKSFPDSWRNDVSISGGGILLDQGIHMLDLFNFFLGGFTSVKSFISNAHWGFDVEDNAVVILKTGDDQLAMLHSSATFWKHMFQLTVILEEGYLTVEGLLSKTGSYGRETLTIGRRQFEDEAEAIGNPSEEVVYFDRDLSWDLEVDKFVEAIRNNTSIVESTSADALSVMELVSNCYKESGFSTYVTEPY